MSLVVLTVVVICCITSLGALIWQDTLSVGAFAVAVMLLIAVLAEQWGAAAVEVVCLAALCGYGVVGPEVER